MICIGDIVWIGEDNFPDFIEHILPTVQHPFILVEVYEHELSNIISVVSAVPVIMVL